MRRPLPVPPRVLRNEPERSVARVCLGLTAWLDEPLTWAREGAVETLRSFLSLAPAESLRWYTTSAMDVWAPFDDPARDKVLQALALPWHRERPRHQFMLRVADDTSAPSTSFAYREVDPSVEARAGWLSVCLPERTDPDDLAEFAIELGHSFPLRCAIGGFVASTDPALPVTSFTALRPWSRRYLGIDLPHPDHHGYTAMTRLPGTGWLTLVGRSMFEPLGLDEAALRSLPWSSSVSAIPLKHAVLLRAGERPSLGDANTLVYPAALAEVAKMLDRHVVAAPPELPGWSPEDAGETSAWTHRFAAPERWS